MFFMEVRIFEEVGYGKVIKYCWFNCSDMMMFMYILIVLIGNLNFLYWKFSCVGLLLWILSMVVNFMYDGYELCVKYGYLWMFVCGLLWVMCCVCIWFIVWCIMLWLEKGLIELDFDRCYRKVLCDMVCIIKVRSFGIICFFFWFIVFILWLVSWIEIGIFILVVEKIWLVLKVIFLVIDSLID